MVKKRKNMKRINQLLFVLTMFTLFTCFNIDAGKLETEQPDRVLKKGSWELQVFYRNKGTRSEGQHGILLYKGEPVEAKKVGEEKETDLGLMKYYGSEKEKEVPWVPSGWNFAGRGKIKPSWQE
jgi:hypothetical protein